MFTPSSAYVLRVLPAFLLALAGCYSMDIASNASISGQPAAPSGQRRVEHVVVSNYGWYLFNYVPLACGNADREAWFPWKFFRDQVTSRLLHDRMMEYAARTDATVDELTFFRDEQVFFTVPGSQIPLPIPYLLCFREVQFSGVLAQRGGEARR